MSIVTKLTKIKKLKLIKTKRLNVAKVNFFKTDFLILKTKKTFINLWKAIIKAPNFHHLDLKYYIYIEIDIIKYNTREVLSKMTLNPFSFDCWI